MGDYMIPKSTFLVRSIITEGDPLFTPTQYHLFRSFPEAYSPPQHPLIVASLFLITLIILPDSSETSSLDSRGKKKKSTKKKNRRKHRKDDSSDPSSSNDSDSSDDSHYRRKRHKRMKHRGKYPIKLCATLTGKVLATAYKSKIIRFKMEEDPLHCRIYSSHL